MQSLYQALTKEEAHKQLLKPKAWIGYLVGYESSSIYSLQDLDSSFQ